jgi:hypothetical protein
MTSTEPFQLRNNLVTGCSLSLSPIEVRINHFRTHLWLIYPLISVKQFIVVDGELIIVGAWWGVGVLCPEAREVWCRHSPFIASHKTDDF